MYVDPNITTSDIEQTRRAMYEALAGVRKAKKHPKATDALESALEAHLEALRSSQDSLMARTEVMRQERDDLQERMVAVDVAYRKSQEALMVAGDELRFAQEVNSSHRIEIKSLNQQLEARDETIGRLRAELKKCQHYLPDLQSAEAMTDELHEKLSAATTVIGQQEQLIAGQRKSIADMHNELTHRRVICRAFENAREAFVVLDVALHDGLQGKAMRAISGFTEVKS